MNKVFLIIALSFIVFVGEVYCIDGYENAKWGDSTESVRQCFPKKNFQTQDQNTIYFSGQDNGENAIIGFDFKNNELNGVTVWYQIETADIEVFTETFERLDKVFITKYGAPDNRTRVSDREPGTTDAYMISAGEGSYVDSWSDAQTEISLNLTGDNFELKLEAIYKSK